MASDEMTHLACVERRCNDRNDDDDDGGGERRRNNDKTFSAKFYPIFLECLPIE
jgi:hypothetical protein